MTPPDVSCLFFFPQEETLKVNTPEHKHTGRKRVRERIKKRNAAGIEICAANAEPGKISL